jgi:hypothetical protein
VTSHNSLSTNLIKENNYLKVLQGPMMNAINIIELEINNISQQYSLPIKSVAPK